MITNIHAHLGLAVLSHQLTWPHEDAPALITGHIVVCGDGSLTPSQPRDGEGPLIAHTNPFNALE